MGSRPATIPDDHKNPFERWASPALQIILSWVRFVFGRFALSFSHWVSYAICNWVRFALFHLVTGGSFDPEEFDPDPINDELKDLVKHGMRRWDSDLYC